MKNQDQDQAKKKELERQIIEARNEAIRAKTREIKQLLKECAR